MSHPFISSSATAPSTGSFGFFHRLIGWISWAVLACLGLMFAIALLLWVLAMVLVSLVASLFTGRPAAVTLLWRRYRDLTRGFAHSGWGRQSARSNTPRADAASAAGTAAPGAVQDVNWREVEQQPGERPDATS